MANYSFTDIFNLFLIHGECNKVSERTCRMFNEKYPHLSPMNKTKLKRLQTKFVQFGQVKPKKSRRSIITDEEENIINVLGYFNAYPRSSIRAASRDLGVSYCSIQKILKKQRMHDFSFTKVQSLRPGDNLRRVQFCEMILIKCQEDANFLRNIIWTDESKFSREGIVNRRNSHYWASANPHLVREAGFQDAFSFNVFCIVMGDRVRYEIYDENLTSARYLQILREVVTDFIDNLPLNVYNNCYYQMDGAPAHSSHEVYLELTRMFGDNWLGLFGPWPWPPRSPDLTPLDFYIWGYIKSKVYATPVQTREELLARVRVAFAELNPEEIMRATVDEVHSRVLKCLEHNGGHIEHLYD